MRRIAASAMLAIVVLSGCASKPQLPVSLGASTLSAPGTRVGVVMTALPKPDTSFPGAACLLCLGVASIANSSLTAHTVTLPHEDLPQLKTMLVDLIGKKGGNALLIDDAIKLDALPNFAGEASDVARKDYRPLQQKYGVDKLLVVSITQIGFERTYSSYVPTSDPKAVLRGVGFIVDLKSNAYEWYQPLNLMRSADGNWDEPAKFPGLTNAYFQVLEEGKGELLQPFLK